MKTARFGDLIELISGQHIDSKNYNTARRGVGYLTGPSDFGMVSPVISKWTEAPKVKAKRGDILLTVKGSGVGRINILDADEVAISRQLMAIRVIHAQPQFVYLFLESALEHFQAAAKGAAIPGISREQVLELPIALPSRAEQRRIVGLLDEALVGLATAMGNAQKNIQNARALFESHLQSLFNQGRKGWKESRLGEIAEFKNGLNFTRQSKGQTLRIVGVGDFQNHAKVPVEDLQSVTVDGQVSEDYLIRRDDIMAVRSNGSKDLVGRCMLVPDVAEEISYSGFVIRIRVDKRVVSPRYLLHLLRWGETRERLTQDGGGANISNISQAKLSDLPVCLPPFSRQEEIAQQLETLSAQIQTLECIYQQKAASLHDLKKSLLHRAFTGSL